MNAADLKAKIEGAKRRLLTAEGEMQRALDSIAHADRSDKRMVSSALGTALAETKAALRELNGLEQIIADA